MYNDYGFRKKDEEVRKAGQASRRKENSFYAKPTNSGIMKPSKPKFGSIQEIKDAQKEQKKRVAEAHKQEWNSIVSGTDDLIMISKQNRKAAEQRVKELDLELTAAYGLGKNGYWSKQSKSYGQAKQVQNKQLDNVVHSFGQQTVPKTPSIKPNIPADPVTRSVSQKPMIVDKTNYGIKPKQDIAKGAQRQKEQQIAQKQDEIVHGQNLGQMSKWKLDEELQKLKAEKEVIVWKQNLPQSPTSEAYDAKKRYYNDQITKASDNYLNEYGGKDGEETKTAWAEYQNMVSDLVARRDAFNRAKMGIDTSTPEQGGIGVNKTLPINVGTEDDESAEVNDGYVHGTQFFGSGVPPNSENELDEVVNPSVLRSHELIEIIGQYYMDKANSNMDIKDFLGKYPYGTQQMIMWKKELTELIGEEETNKLFSNWSKIDEGREKQIEKIEAIKDSQEESFEYLNNLFPNDEIVTEVMNSSIVDSEINPDVDNLIDLSADLNGVIQKCCDEFKYPAYSANSLLEINAAVENALVWTEGVFNHWNFIGDKFWKDNPDIGYDSYIPDDIQGKAPDAQKDFFIVNGYRMNREQWNNYIKGATAQYAFPDAPVKEIIDVLDMGITMFYNIRDDIKQEGLYNFTWDNMIEDSYFAYLGARDMRDEVIE